MSVREKHLDVALEPPEQFGELAQGVSPCRVGRKTEGRRRRATRECAGLIIKRAKRILPFKHALLLRFAAASECLSAWSRQASRSSGCGSAWVRHAAALQPTRI